MVGSVTHRLGNELGTFTLANRISYGVLVERVEYHYHREAVVVGRYALAALCDGLLVVELHIPTVQTPHIERSGRRRAAVLHRALVVKLFRAEATARRFEVVTLTPQLDGGGGDWLPTQFFGYDIVQHCHLFVVEVAVVAHQAHNHRLLFIACYLCSVRVLELARDQNLVVRCATSVELIVLLTQAACVLGERVREAVCNAWQHLRPCLPKATEVYSLAELASHRGTALQ